MEVGSLVLAFSGASAPGGKVPSAQAAARCTGVRIHAADDVGGAWASAVEQLKQQVPAAGPSDCAGVTVSIEPGPSGEAHLAAMAWDGRFTERNVQRPADLAATVLGLIASIPAEGTTADPEQGPASQPSLALSPPEPTLAPAPAAPPATPPVRLLLGLGAGIRFTAPSPMELLDFEARGDVIVRDWIVSLSLRYAPSIGPDNSDTTYEELVAGLGVGRRFHLGAESLDVSVLPTVAVMNMQWDEDDPDAKSDGTAEFRLALHLRWAAPINRFWQLTITADTDLTPAGLDHVERLGPTAPALPAWTGGVRIGGTGLLL